MNKEDRLIILKEAHAKYVEWWMPIDLACDSCMGAMSCHRFCETLLTMDGGFGVKDNFIDNWWDKWVGDVVPKDKKMSFKQHILKLIIGHYTDTIDLNE